MSDKGQPRQWIQTKDEDIDGISWIISDGNFIRAQERFDVTYMSMKSVIGGKIRKIATDDTENFDVLR